MKGKENSAEWSYEGDFYTLVWDKMSKTASIRYGDHIDIRFMHPLVVFHTTPVGRGTTSREQPHIPSNLPQFSRAGGGEWHRLLRKGRLLFLHNTSTMRHTNRSMEILAPESIEEPHMMFRILCHHDKLEMHTILKNSSRHPIAIDKVIPLVGRLTLDPPISRWRFFKMSSNTSTPSGSVPLTDTERVFGFGYVPQSILPRSIRRMLYLPGEPISWRHGLFSSQWFTLLVKDGSGPSLCIGFLGSRGHFSSIHLDQKNALLQALSYADGVEVPSGGSFQIHTLVLIFGSEPYGCIDTYLSEFTSTITPRKQSISLWGSWYAGFYDRFSATDLKENLSQIADSNKDLVEYFQIDDGYQKALGDWLETNSRVPEGLEAFAQAVIKKGLKPGIWVAPFVVSRDASIFNNHRDWLVKGPKGSPLMAGLMPGRFTLRPYYALDITVPEVQEWLTNLFRRLVEWGFQLFKLDYLGAGAVSGKRLDPCVTSAQAYSLGLSVIRDAVGNIPIMGALAPLLGGVGWVDMQRVSTDTSFGGNKWLRSSQRILQDPITPCIRNNIRNNLARAFLHNSIWTNDCDALVQEGLSVEQRKTHLSVNLLMGGVCQIGHDVRKGEYFWEDIRRLRQYVTLSCRIPDLFEKQLPEEAMGLALRTGGKNKLLFYLLVNLSSRFSRKRIRNPNEYFDPIRVDWSSVIDFWENGAATIKEGDAVSLPPHGCKLFLFELQTS